MKARSVWTVTKEGLKAQWPQRIIGVAIITFLIMTLFGLTFENGPTADISTDIVILDQAGEEDSAAGSVIAELGNRNVVAIENVYTLDMTEPLSKALDDLEDGDVAAVIVFGPNFTAGIENWIAQAGNGSAAPPTSLVMYLDGSNPITSSALQGEVQRSVQTVLVMEYGVAQPVRIVPDVVYGEGTDMREYMAPGIATLLIFIMTMIPAMMTSNGLYKSASTNGGRSAGDVIAGQAIVTLIVGSVQVTTVILTMFMFSIIDLDSTLLVFALFLIFTMASTGLGLLIGYFVQKKPSAGMALLPLLLYPAILMSGLIISVSSIPEYLLPLSYFFPLTYSIEGVRQTVLGGFGLEKVWVEIAILTVYALVAYSMTWWLATRSRKSEDR